MHPNMIGNNDGGLSMEIGFTIVSSKKQKLNTQSSTETEILSVDDCIPAKIWTIYWLDAQRYDVFENIVYQDNNSAILLENNGKASSSKRINHINVRYYFVIYWIEKDKLSLEWCPTAYIIGYLMTKPSQGAEFNIFRDQLMGDTEAQDPGPENLKNIVKIK